MENTVTPAQLAAFQTAALEHLVEDFNAWSDTGDDPVAYCADFVFNYAVRPSGVADLFYYVNDPHQGCPNFPLLAVYPSGKIAGFHNVETLDDCYWEKVTTENEFKVTYSAADFI
jgi:hypothetical protein